MNRKLKTALASTSAVVATLSTTAVAFAQTADNPLDLSLQDPNVGVDSLQTLINSAFQAALILAILVVFAMLIIGAYEWLTAGGEKAKVEEARTRITNAVIGLAIVAAAWVILTIVGNFFGINPTNIVLPSAATPADSGQPPSN